MRRSLVKYVNEFSLLLLLFALLGIIALVFNIIGVLDIVSHFLQNLCGCAANFVTREGGHYHNCG